jgi:hypothetical protein
MGRCREIFRDEGWRVIFALPCFAMAFYIFITSDRLGLPFSVPFLLGGAVIVAPLFTTMLAEPFRAIFYPVDRFDGPQPMYGVPASKRAWGRYEDAIHGYEEIARKYPDDLKPYVEMIHIAVVDLRDEDRAKAILDKALTVLTKEEDKAILTRIYEANKTLLHSAPAWLEKQQERVLTPPDLSDQPPVDEPDGLHKRRFHAGGYGQNMGPDTPRFLDLRAKMAYRKKDPPASI